MVRGYTIDDVKDKLLTMDAVREKLASTEPLGAIQLPAGDDINFKLNDGWNHGIDAAVGTDPVAGWLDIKNGGEYTLTLDALLEATTICNLPKGFVLEKPAYLVEPVLNHVFQKEKLGKEFKVLTNGDYAAAIINGTISQFSNLRLLDEILNRIEAQYGKGEVFADYKMEHSIKNTHLRLIIPEKTRVIKNTGTDDDTWSVGIQLKNSLISAEQTSLDAYMFCYWCTNGAIDKHNSEAWNRKQDGQNPDDVYAWARTEVDSILGGMEASLDNVQAMTDIPIEGNITQILSELQKELNVPSKLHNAIIAEMLSSDNLTMYTLMQAITSQANEAGVKATDRDRLMMAGGKLAYESGSRCTSCGSLSAHAH